MRSPDALARGQWTRWNHSGAGYVSDQAFRFTSPRWVFGSDGPLAALCEQFPEGADVRDRDVYQFGVYTGGSMAGQVLYFRDLQVRFGTMWGFDSFVGLPPEAPDAQLLTKNWKPGAYSTADALRLWNWPRVETALRKSIGRRPDEGDLAFIRGFYNATLRPTLAREQRMQPALYVDVDADLYISSIQLLDWLFCSDLMVASPTNGTLVRYDDWGGPTRVDKLVGERRAHLEVSIRHRVRWSQPALLSNWFRVEAYSLDTGHCARRGYPRAATGGSASGAVGSAGRGVGGHERLLACIARVDMWKRPFVSRHGMQARCTHKYHRHLRKTYGWARQQAQASSATTGTEREREPAGSPQRPEFCEVLGKDTS